MPKVTTVHNNFTAGELSPKMHGRVDVARYQAGAEEIVNGWPVVHGGVDKRWGTLYHAAAKHADKKARLVPFVFSRTQAYILEFGHNYMRVHTDAGVILSAPSTPFEIATPYTESMLATMDFTQAADTMLLWHEAAYPRRVRRFADDNWVLDLAPFNPAPFAEVGFRPATTLTLSAATVGVGRTFSTSAAAFLETDVGREIWAGVAGIATITGYTDTQHVTCEITSAFDATSYTSTNWKITGTPVAACSPSGTGPIGETITLALGSVEAEKTITGLSWLGSVVTVTIVGHGYSSSDTAIVAGNSPSAYNGTYTVTVVDTDTFTYTLASDPGAATVLGTVAKSTASADGWRSSDVGKHVQINQGLVKISEYVDATTVKAVVLTELNTSVTAVANSWVLNDAVWNDIDGYPATGTFNSQRLLAAGSPAYPQTVWGSGIADYYAFQIGANDDEAFAFDLVSDDLSPITYLSSMDSLVALTYAGEFTMDGGVEKPITPTNIRAKPRTNNGCAQVRPVRVGDEELYVERGGKAVRAVAYDPETGRWACPDVSVLAEHITKVGLVDLTWNRKPNSLVFAARSDGLVASCTYDREQDVIGWSRQDVGGVVESVATIPSGAGDRTWLIVRRVIDGATVRYIEKFDEETYVDSAVNGSNVAGATVWTNLDHLEGKAVRVLADGVPQPEVTVTGGQIELPRKAYAVQIGLPFNLRIKLLPPEVNGTGGAAQGSAVRTSEVSIRLLDTSGLVVNGQTVAFRKLGEGVLNQPIEPFTGIKRIENLGFDRGDSPIVIEHTDPLPCHVLSVIRKLTFNEG